MSLGQPDLIDGYDIGKVELYSLRRQIGIVPQDHSCSAEL